VAIYKGVVPDNIEDLQTLPGVGRKTANVVASVAFNKPAMAVDTHVFRVSARIGLTQNAKTPLETEKQLVKYIPEYIIPKAHHWLILHGRYVCKARKPECEKCGLTHCNNMPIPLELHHKDGNSHNHALSNLELLCLNSHA
jgi:endonuclease-3